MRKEEQREYAKILANYGANVQRGQRVEIHAEVEDAEFVRILAEECLAAGASTVLVDWQDQRVNSLNARLGSEEELVRVEHWEIEKVKQRASDRSVAIHLISAMSETHEAGEELLAQAQISRRKILRPYEQVGEGHHQWLVAAVPNVTWARQLFPKMNAQEATEKLWEVLLHVARADIDDGWKKHIDYLQKRAEYLNAMQIRKLHYEAANGTDLSVELPEGALFWAGEDRTLEGIDFCPNIPTEECYTSPKRGCAEGIVRASKPLYYQGQAIENMCLTFREGRVVSASADKNEDLLHQLLAADEGASYLGECAFVPFDNPINNSGLVFRTTLLDENACCHLAFGHGFSQCVRGGGQMSRDALAQAGINESAIHIDFMIGTPDLCITAECNNGDKVRIFETGTWAF